MDEQEPEVSPLARLDMRRMANTVIFGSTGTFGAELFQQTVNYKVPHQASPHLIQGCQQRIWIYPLLNNFSQKMSNFWQNFRFLPLFWPQMFA